MVERSTAAIANDAWEALLTSHATLMKEFATEDTWVELSMREYDVLYSLTKSSSPLTMNELNRSVLLSQPALSRMVDRLVDRGLVSRHAHDSDGRSVNLSLTKSGRECQRIAGSKHARNVMRSMDVLDVDEMRALEAICTKLAQGNR